MQRKDLNFCGVDPGWFYQNLKISFDLRVIFILTSVTVHKNVLYITENHTFDEFSKKVLFFDELGKTLNDSLPKGEQNSVEQTFFYKSRESKVIRLVWKHFP